MTTPIRHFRPNITVVQVAAPTTDAYMPELRAALRTSFAKIPNGDQPRFWGVYTDIQVAFDMRQPASFIKALISNVKIGLGATYEDGSQDEENRPDLEVIKEEMLNLPEWP